MRHRASRTILFCAMVAVASAQTATPAVTAPALATKPVDERFVTAFLRPGTFPSLLVPRVTVALSSDGVTWTDAMFPSLSGTNPVFTGGVAVCGSADGQKLSVFLTSRPAGAILATEGVVANGVVSWSPARWLPAADPESAPSCTYLPDDVRIVVYRSGSTVIAQLYDGGDQFFQQALPQMNNFASGRPSVTSVGGKAIVAWRRGAPGCADVVLAQGEYTTHGQHSLFSFTAGGFTLALDDSHTGACTTEDPALGSDGSRFYVAVIQEQSSTGVLHGWDTIVYGSLGPELYSGLAVLPWQIPCGNRSQSNLNIAFKEDRTILAAAVLRSGDASVPVSCLGRPTTADSLSWQDTGRSPFLDKTDVLYVTQFAVSRIGPRRVPDFQQLAPSRLKVPQLGIKEGTPPH
jgi:hypothetical protein